MRLTETTYFKQYLKALGSARPERIWQKFLSLAELPSLRFSTEVSAVFSSQIEGNTIDLNTYLRSKARGEEIRFKSKERKEIDALVEAYTFAQSHALTEKNLLFVHDTLALPLLPKASRGRYRTGAMAVYSRHGIEYVAVEPQHVAELMGELIKDARAVTKSRPDAGHAFYHAALLHLLFVHIHPFPDGNGRAARLLEKWLLASCLGTSAWKIPSESYYKENLAAYYNSIKLGSNYYELDYKYCLPFLTMLVSAVRSVL